MQRENNIKRQRDGKGGRRAGDQKQQAEGGRAHIGSLLINEVTLVI